MRHWPHFAVASETGKHLHEVMGWEGPVTNPQFLVWVKWLEIRANPDRQEDIPDWEERVKEGRRRQMEADAKRAEQRGVKAVVVRIKQGQSVEDLLRSGITRSK